LALLLALCLPVSCMRNSSITTLDLPSTPAVSTLERYALVLDPYISLRDLPGETGITIAHGRRGEIYEVSGKRIVQTGTEGVIWLHLGEGWVLASSVQLYSSREKAETAAAALK
jgi:hypothetical protein